MDASVEVRIRDFITRALLSVLIGYFKQENLARTSRAFEHLGFAVDCWWFASLQLSFLNQAV